MKIRPSSCCKQTTIGALLTLSYLLTGLPEDRCIDLPHAIDVSRSNVVGEVQPTLPVSGDLGSCHWPIMQKSSEKLLKCFYYICRPGIEQTVTSINKHSEDELYYARLKEVACTTLAYARILSSSQWQVKGQHWLPRKLMISSFDVTKHAKVRLLICRN